VTPRTRRAALAGGVAWALGAAALLAGCASLQPPATARELGGRLSVRIDATDATPSRSFAADFDLRGDDQRGELRLTGPLGSTLADVRWRPGAAELTDANGRRDYPTLEALARDLLGEPLPLAALTDWLRGRPWAGAPHAWRDGGFDQLGWRVDLAGFAQGVLQARRDGPPAVQVRARLESPA
jgi:outer membrane lipoprotein LolB